MVWWRSYSTLFIYFRLCEFNLFISFCLIKVLVPGILSVYLFEDLHSLMKYNCKSSQRDETTFQTVLFFNCKPVPGCYRSYFKIYNGFTKNKCFYQRWLISFYLGCVDGSWEKKRRFLFCSPTWGQVFVEYAL